MRLLQYKRLSSLPVNLLYKSETSGFLYDNLGTNLNKFEKSEDAIDIVQGVHLLCKVHPPPPQTTHPPPPYVCSVYFQTLRSIINKQYIPDPVTIIINISISLPLQYILRNELDTGQVSSDFRFPIDLLQE